MQGGRPCWLRCQVFGGHRHQSDDKAFGVLDTACLEPRHEFIPTVVAFPLPLRDNGLRTGVQFLPYRLDRLDDALDVEAEFAAPLEVVDLKARRGDEVAANLHLAHVDANALQLAILAPLVGFGEVAFAAEGHGSGHVYSPVRVLVTTYLVQLSYPWGLVPTDSRSSASQSAISCSLISPSCGGRRVPAACGAYRVRGWTLLPS